MPQTANQQMKTKPLTSVMEDYLEAIFDLNKTRKVVRVRDIAGKMDVKMPTVTSMLKTLSERGMIHYEKYEYVGLTERGKKVGLKIHHRHELFRRFLMDILNVPPNTADEEACKMEHAFGDDTLNRLTHFMAFIQQCPEVGETWRKQFESYYKKGQLTDSCRKIAEKIKPGRNKTQKPKKKRSGTKN